MNYNDFYIEMTTNEIISNYKTAVSSVVIKNNFVSGPASGDSVMIMDPWLVDIGNDEFYVTPYGYKNLGMNAPYVKEESPLNLNFSSKFKGVFLDQNPDPNDPDKPYYSVKAEAQQTFRAHNQDITGYFLGWEGTQVDFEHPDQQETAVVFKAENAEARAVYKGHLASSIARASGYNNGRRICKTNDGKLHLVYEDDNTIWYTYSTNNGQTWVKEYAISPHPYSQNSIAHSFKNPSIATDGNRLYVVFEEVVQSNSSTNHLIDFRKWENNSWRPIENISDGSWQGDWWDGPWSERPSVSANDVNDVFVSWRDKTNLKIKARYYYNNQSWSYISTIYSDGYPATTVLPSGEDYPLKIVWAQNGNIKYVSGQYYASSNRCYWSSIQTISNYSPPIYSDHEQPSVTSDRYGHGYVSWVAINQDWGVQSVLYQKFNFGYQATSASSTYELSRDEDFTTESPSVSYDRSNQYVTVFYQHHDNIYRKRQSGSSWSLYYYDDGKYPNICPDKSAGAVWTKFTSAPYLLKTENLNNWLAKSTIAEVESFKRFYYSRTDSNYFTVDLKEFTADGQSLTFYKDLNSDTITIKGPTDFSYQLEIGEDIEPCDLLSFYFVTDKEKYFLDDVQLTGDEAKTVIEKNLSFDPGQPLTGYVQIEFKEKQPFVINVVPDNGSVNLAKSVATQSTLFVPQKFDLKQNFPNPFNPTTQISFDLPVDARITLQVFDLSGHMVATLAQGFRSVGRYSVVFDGRNLASGIYIYRLTTNKGFVQSRKMMLIK